MKKCVSFLLCIALLWGLLPVRAARAESVWPENVSIEAEGGIVMDAATGAILYGKNIHNPYYPASITKILTALIVLENCSLNETVTFSHDAVYNVESGSTSAGLDVGDELSVNDCLYALLLKSANEVANALAEHVAGSNEAFAEMMNQKAASLGCVDSHFANPSGLNDADHYTSAYDMALISQAAMQNDTFMKIDSTLYYDLPVTKRNPEGGRIYPGHKMLKKNLPEYYPGCLGGKTGYTSLAGNTLVTFAERDGMKLIAVILNGHQSHYRDTKALLDFGFKNFQTIKADGFDSRYTSVENDMLIAGLPAADLAGLKLDPDGALTLPLSADLTAVASYLTYQLPGSAPENAVARVDYFWNDRMLGHAYLVLNTTGDDTSPIPATMLAEINDITLQAASGPSESSEPAPTEREPFYVPPVVWVLFGAAGCLAVLFLVILAIRSYMEKKENEARMRRRQKRMSRMGDGVSSVDIDLEMERRRNYYTARRSPKNRRRR